MLFSRPSYNNVILLLTVVQAQPPTNNVQPTVDTEGDHYGCNNGKRESNRKDRLLLGSTLDSTSHEVFCSHDHSLREWRNEAN